MILFFPLSSLAIELVLNGKTYDIKEYKVENNGQRIVINHINTDITHGQENCVGVKPSIKTQSFKPAIIEPGPFQRLMDELDSGVNQNDKMRKQRFQ